MDKNGKASTLVNVHMNKNETIHVHNRFGALMDMSEENFPSLMKVSKAAALEKNSTVTTFNNADIMNLEADKNMPTKTKMRGIGKGKITIDSGAAESVMPTSMLPQVPIYRSSEEKMNTRYTAANGGRLYNEGEKKVFFKNLNDTTVGMSEFQCMDVKKPLASVAKIVDKGNRVVFEPTGAFIQSIETGKKIPLVREHGTYAMEVEFLAEVNDHDQMNWQAGFTWQK